MSCTNQWDELNHWVDNQPCIWEGGIGRLQPPQTPPPPLPPPPPPYFRHSGLMSQLATFLDLVQPEPNWEMELSWTCIEILESGKTHSRNKGNKQLKMKFKFFSLFNGFCMASLLTLVIEGFKACLEVNSGSVIVMKPSLMQLRCCRCEIQLG